MSIDPSLPQTALGKSFSNICDELFVRRIMRYPILENARIISDIYDGRMVVPMPEIDEAERPANANLVAQNIDQHAMRVASVRPTRTVYPSNPGKAAANKLARAQKRVLSAWDDDMQRELFDRRRARWLTAWSEAPVVVRPDPLLRQPVWELRSPLGCYPSPLRPYDNMRPLDCINTFERTYQWLKTAYPQLDTLLNFGRKIPYRADDRFECVEYVDDEVIVMGVLGVGTLPPFAMLAAIGFVAFPIQGTAKGQSYAIELERTPNLAETCPAVVPARITLDMPKGMADDMVGIFQMEAKMMALHVNAVARAIYPNNWFIEAPAGGEIVTQADGLRGIMGHVTGGTVQQLGMQPGAQTMPLIGALDNNMRISGAAPMDWSGESPTNVRTAQRGLNVASAAVDFYIQEHQQLLARSFQYEEDIAIRIDRAYFRGDRKTYFVKAGPNQGEQTYTPGELWATIPKVQIAYNNAGMDANSIVIANGQKLGEGTISRETVMTQDPSIEDVESELGRITADRLADALLAAVSQQAQTGVITPADLAQIMLYVESGDFNLPEAVTQVDQEARTRQASSGAPGTPEGPAQPGSPQVQVGIQGGPQGAAQPVIPGANPSQVNLKSLLSALMAGSNQ